MPRRLRYSKLLGLNARGLTRQQKTQIVWKKHVKGKFNRAHQKPALQKRVNTKNSYWNKYHDEEQRFDAMGLKPFLQNPAKIFKIQPAKRKTMIQKLKSAQLNIEQLKYKYSVAIPDKQSLKLLTILAQAQGCHGIVQLKTSNHCQGYWAYLLSQKKNMTCKAYNFYNDKSWKKKKINKNNKQNSTKSKKILAAEAKEWINICNKDCSANINDILKDCSRFVLLMIYPDFMMDFSVINDGVMQRRNRNYGGQEDGYRTFGKLMDGKEGFPSVECLKCYKGNYVVHVGELFGCTYSGSNVWGRTTSKQFQIELQTHFHKIYQQKIYRWPLFRDSLTIWRRNIVKNVGNEQIVSLPDVEMNDGMNTKYWRSVFTKSAEKKARKKNIFEGANYREGTGIK